jgi:hypothetical protein
MRKGEREEERDNWRGEENLDEGLVDDAKVAFQRPGIGKVDSDFVNEGFGKVSKERVRITVHYQHIPFSQHCHKTKISFSLLLLLLLVTWTGTPSLSATFRATVRISFQQPSKAHPSPIAVCERVEFEQFECGGVYQSSLFYNPIAMSTSNFHLRSSRRISLHNFLPVYPLFRRQIQHLRE